MSDLHTAADRYVALGLAIFPLAPRTKFPLRGSHGWKDAAPDAKPWELRRDCNIGLAARPNRLVLLDADDPTVFDGMDLPPTWTVEATRGPHLWYRLPAGRECMLAGIPARLDVIDGGFGVLPPSVHPSGRRYRWREGRHPWSMPITELPFALTCPEDDMRVDDYESDGSAVDCFLGAAFASLGWLGAELGEGKHAVRCPWREEHSSDTGPSSTVIFAPRTGSRWRIGSFVCRHGHCVRRRTGDVLEKLPRAALVAAAKAGYRGELSYLGSGR